MRRKAWMILAAALLGCADDGSPEAHDEKDETDTPASAADKAAFEQQVALGATTFGQKCSACHGDKGQGTQEAPRLVGLAEGALPRDPRPGSKRAIPFVTVADVASFAVNNMPPGRAGTLSADEYWAIVAFDLSANGITLDQKLTPALAATLTIPR